MINLILKSLKVNCALSKNQIMEEVAKDGILVSEPFLDKMLAILESDRKIIHLKSGDYMLFDIPHKYN